MSAMKRPISDCIVCFCSCIAIPDRRFCLTGMDFDILAVTHKSNVRLRARVTKLVHVEEPEDKDKHYAPQHRKYLTHPKVGDGTPTQRAKMDRTYRLDQAIAHATTYRMDALGYTNHADANMVTRSSGIDGIVEDKIQLSIMQGEFDNLPGAGQPLKQEWNPFIDSTTAAAFKIMQKNGVKPEWVEKQSIINQLTQDLRARIRGVAAQLWLSNFKGGQQQQQRQQQPVATTISAAELSAVAASSLQQDVGLLNRQIDTYNLQVPAHHLTRMRFSLSSEAERVASELSVITQAQAQQLIQAAQAAERSSQPLYASLRGYTTSTQVNPYTTPVAQFLFRKGAEGSSWHGIQEGGMYGNPAARKANQSTDVLMRTLMAPVDRLTDVLLRMLSHV